MSLSTSEFIAALASEVPETTGTLSAHRADQEDELLLHLFAGDLRLPAYDWFRVGRIDALGRLLSVLGRGLSEVSARATSTSRTPLLGLSSKT